MIELNRELKLPNAFSREAGANRLPILADEIQAAHEACRRSTQEAVEHAIKAGRRLIEAKRLVPHGEWADWLRANVGAISVRTAQRYMRAAERAGENDTVSYSSLRELIAPAPRPDEEVRAAIAALNDNRRALRLMMNGSRELLEGAIFIRLKPLDRLFLALGYVGHEATAAWEDGRLYRLRRFADVVDFKQQAAAYADEAVEWAERVAGPMKLSRGIHQLKDDPSKHEKRDPAGEFALWLIAAWLVGIHFRPVEAAR